MNETDSKFYCRIDASMVDYCDEKEVREHSREMASFCDLSERFSLLKRAYETANKEHTNIVINPLPPMSGVAELSVFHCVKRKIFSRKVKANFFYLSIDRYDSFGEMGWYECKTESIEKVEEIFRDFIEKRKLPSLLGWKYKYIGKLDV